MSINIASLNAQGLGSASKNKRRELFYWLHKQKYNIILLQETHSSKEIENIWESEWGYKIVFSHGTTASRGVCILFKNNFNLTVHQLFTDDEGRYIIADVSINDVRLSLGNIYGPNLDSPDFFEEVYIAINNIPNDIQIIGGDFNCILHPQVDKVGEIGTHMYKHVDF